MNGAFFRNPGFLDPENNYSLERRVYTILKDNTSKKVKVYSTIKNEEKNPKVFSGIFENYIDDSIILSDPGSGNWYFIPIDNVNYIEFEERIVF